MNTNFIEKTLSSLVEQQMNISNAVLQRQPSCYEMIPSKQNVAFHNWEEYKRLGLKWGEPIVIVRIVSNNVFYLEYKNGRYSKKLYAKFYAWYCFICYYYSFNCCMCWCIHWYFQ